MYTVSRLEVTFAYVVTVPYIQINTFIQLATNVRFYKRTALVFKFKLSNRGIFF